MAKVSLSASGSDVTADLTHLASADRTALVSLWQKVVGRPVPANLSVPFLRRALAFEIQCAALGAPKARCIADLQRIAAGRPAAASVGARLQPGARLIREWQGKTFTVEVTEAGFVMAGEQFASLSAIAQRITGAHWSGPRFFGLKVGQGAGVRVKVREGDDTPQQSGSVITATVQTSTPVSSPLEIA